MSSVDAPSNTGVAIGTPLEIFSTSSNNSFLFNLLIPFHNILLRKYLLIFS
jgi:hypothetical protein